MHVCLPISVAPLLLLHSLILQIVQVNDRSALDKLGVSRDQLVSRICRGYAHTIYRNGIFNSDPHPGNFFVARLSSLVSGDPSDPENARLLRLARARRALRRRAAAAADAGDAGDSGAGGDAEGAADGAASEASSEKQSASSAKAKKAGAAKGSAASNGNDDDEEESWDDEWIPVLLDFGLCKRLPDGLRLAFAKLVVAAEELDFAGMMEVSHSSRTRVTLESRGSSM